MSSDKQSDPVAEAVDSLGIIQVEEDPDAIREVSWPQLLRNDEPDPSLPKRGTLRVVF